VLDQSRILVGSQSNFGAPLAIGVGAEGSFLSIDPSGAAVLNVPPKFAQGGAQSSTLGGAVQMFSANSPNWLNAVNNAHANTAPATLGLVHRRSSIRTGGHSTVRPVR